MKAQLLLAALVATGVPGVPRGQEASKPQPVERTVHLLVMLRMGPAWTDGAQKAPHPALKAHGEYMDRLFEAGNLVMAGPLLHDSGVFSLEAVTGAVLVLRVVTPQEARRLAQADPAVQAGLLEVVDVRHWGIALSRCQ